MMASMGGIVRESGLKEIFKARNAFKEIGEFLQSGRPTRARPGNRLT
jgi:hypothetical protein